MRNKWRDVTASPAFSIIRDLDKEDAAAIRLAEIGTRLGYNAIEDYKPLRNTKSLGLVQDDPFLRLLEAVGQFGEGTFEDTQALVWDVPNTAS